ncbi:MAG: hypothetical protein JNM83_07015 [Myxococcales bacterium]|jgi:hypothetical protein|nr:hypothetical protein [Myxococcales bacterium]
MAEASAALLYPKTCAATFSCRQCRHSAQVVFHDPDAFAEDEPIGGRSRWMQEAAMEQALRKLHDKSKKALSLVPCPKCGGIDEPARRQAYLRAALPLLAVVPVMLPTLTMLFGVVAVANRVQAALLALAVTGALATLVVLWGQRRLVGDARRSVRFS